VIVSLAGRRIDAAGAEPGRFPADREAVVAKRIATTLSRYGTTALVCAAACGADLLALEAAQRAGIEIRIVLPYDPAEFRRGSVTDRGESWGGAFDRLVGAAQARGGLRILGLDTHDPHVYEKTNAALLDDALALAGNDAAGVVALAVWDGATPGRRDYTADFVQAARARGITLDSIPILAE
jgi:hypothetical protein